MSHQNQEVIQIDDSNSRSQEHPQEHAAQSNNISLNFNPQVFPKLYSLLSKKQDIKEKAQPTLPVKQTPKPEAIPMVIDEPEAIEVSTIIKILPPPIQPKASQTIKQGEINQNKENNTTEVTQMNRDILIVQENFEPLLEQPLVQQPQQNPPEVLECQQNILNQEKEGQIMVCPVEPMVIQQAPNIIIQRQDNLQCQQPQFSQSIIANPQPTQHIEVQIDNNKIEHNISDPQTNQDLIENNREIVIPSIIQDHHMDIEEAIKPEDQQINESIPDVNQNVLPNLNEGLGTHEIVTIPEQNTSKLDFNVDQIAQMKKKIGQQIPELSISIQYMTNQEVLDTYNNLQQQHFNIIKEPIIQNKPQTLPLQRYENQQSITLQLINQSTNQIQTFSQQKQKLSIHMNESYPNLEAMASLGQEQLRNNLTINYPQAKDSLLQMNYQELRSLLSEVLVQIKKKQTNNNQQAKQIPANQADQTEKTEQDHSNKPAITKADMIKTLTQLNPNLKLLFEKMDQSYIKDLYNQSIELKLGSSLQNNNKIMKKIILDDKISHSFILQLCSEKFPHLQDQVRQLTEQEIKKIYEDVSNHEGPWNIPLLLQKYKISPAQQQNTNKALQLQQNVRMEKQNIENEIPVLSLARSHSMMENPETINMKPVQNQLQLKAGQHNILKIKKPNVEENIQQIDVSSKKTQQGKVQKKKGLKNMAPGELRAKLIAKLPQLKDNIMRLDDKEIQKIFRESMQNSKAQSANQSKKLRYDQEFKPVIIIPDKKYRPELEKQLQQKNKEMIIDQEKTKVYQIKDSSKKKKMRTMVVIHTEQIDESAQNGYKMKRTDNGIEKKGVGYDSASRLQISEIIKLLTEAIERRDE